MKMNTWRVCRLVALAALLAAATACGTTSGGGPGPDIDPTVDGTAPKKDLDTKAVKDFEAAVALYEGAAPGAVPYAQIEAKLKSAVDKEDAFASAWFNLGVLAHEQGKQDEAMEYYQKAFERDNTSAAPLVNMAVINIEQGEKDKAFDLLLKATEVEPFTPEGHNNLAVFFRDRKGAQGPDFPKSVEHVRRALAGDSQSMAAYHTLALIYYSIEKYDLARLVCLNALEFDPNNAPIRNVLGLIYLKINNVTLALREFRKAVELEDDFVEAHMNIGSILLSTRDYATAMKHFERVLQLEPKNTEAMLSRAVAHRAMGDLDKAMSGYKEVLSVNGEYAPAHFNIAVMNHEIFAAEATDPDKAIEFYQVAIENYRKYLSLDESSDQEARKDADQRISNCTQLIETQEQLKEMMKDQPPPDDGGGEGGGEGEGGEEPPPEG